MGGFYKSLEKIHLKNSCLTLPHESKLHFTACFFQWNIPWWFQGDITTPTRCAFSYSDKEHMLLKNMGTSSLLEHDHADCRLCSSTDSLPPCSPTAPLNSRVNTKTWTVLRADRVLKTAVQNLYSVQRSTHLYTSDILNTTDWVLMSKSFILKFHVCRSVYWLL